MNTNRHRRFAGFTGLAAGLLIALAANLTYTYPLGNVMIGTGLIAPMILPLVLWVRSTFQVTRRLDRIVREVSVLCVGAPAAALSYSHTYYLMTNHHVAPWLAALLPLSADGIAAISTLAIHRSGGLLPRIPAQTPVPVAEPVAEKAAAPATPELVQETAPPKRAPKPKAPAAPSALTEPAVDPALLARARNRLAEKGQLGRNRLAGELGVTPHQARRVLAALSTNGSGPS